VKPSVVLLYLYMACCVIFGLWTCTRPKQAMRPGDHAVPADLPVPKNPTGR
jgi:hypothetical protein